MNTLADAPAIGCPSGLGQVSARIDHRNDIQPFVRLCDGQARLDLSVSGAKCGGCLSKIERAVGALPGVEVARLNLSSGKLSVRWRGDLSGDTIANTVSALGYGVSVHRETEDARRRSREEQTLLIAMGVAGFSAANIMLLSVSVWSGVDMGSETRLAFHVISGLIALPVILFSGQHFFRSAYGALRHGHVNMDVPISLAVALAFTTSVWETATGGQHAYFDACVMLLFFLLIGRFLDARLRRRAFDAAHGLAALRTQSVTRIDQAGHAERVRADEIDADDTVILAPGERAIVDMTIMQGESEVDESLVTGEVLPRQAVAGSKIFAGTINLGAALQGTALAPASDSLLSDIAAMLDAGEQRRSAYRKIADRAVSLYVPFVHTTAALAFAGWLLAGASVQTALLVAVSTLIITCPCALALAAPVVQVVASGRLFRSGVFLKSGDALERLASVDHIVFDKTGTLTLGTPTWRETSNARAVLNKAAQLARTSRHPLSRAIASAAGNGPAATSVTEHPGLGLEGTVDGVVCRLGRAEWVGAVDDLQDGPVFWFCEDDHSPVRFCFEDRLRDDALETLIQLKNAGYSMEILSGDSAPAVKSLADILDLESWTAKAWPGDKVTRLETLASTGQRTLMVGDGLNDAGALSLAHASLAPGGAMDLSLAACDAVYSGSISSILETLQTAQHARRAMVQNFALAAGYNLIAVPIAVTGHVTPLIAAVAMSASSLVVTLNALRMGSVTN